MKVIAEQEKKIDRDNNKKQEFLQKQDKSHPGITQLFKFVLKNCLTEGHKG